MYKSYVALNVAPLTGPALILLIYVVNYGSPVLVLLEPAYLSQQHFHKD